MKVLPTCGRADVTMKTKVGRLVAATGPCAEAGANAGSGAAVGPGVALGAALAASWPKPAVAWPKLAAGLSQLFVGTARPHGRPRGLASAARLHLLDGCARGLATRRLCTHQVGERDAIVFGPDIAQPMADIAA